ncbi:MAG: hypothetical protein HY870_02825 [Chloroflexi bacterium]|nr:hypothetical protein [Chloroflexota bacterium]
MFRSLIKRAALGLLILTVAACSSTPTATPAPIAPVAAPTTAAPTTAAATTNQNPAAPAATTVPAAAPTTAPAATVAPEPTATISTAIVSTKLNLNTATADELLAGIPGMGNRMIRESLEYRPYVSIQQFRREIGKYVDDAQVAEYEKYVYVPIAINEADAATLQQIPGLDANEAAELIAARPFASNEAFLTRLAAYISASEAVVAQTYLSTP